jgi:hypothetical protein
MDAAGEGVAFRFLFFPEEFSKERFKKAHAITDDLLLYPGAAGAV